MNYASPLIGYGMGLAASNGPNLVDHLVAGESISSPELVTDVIVDTGGWALTSFVTEPVLTVGGAVLGEIVVPEGGGLVGGVAGYLVGSVGASVAWDVWGVPIVRPWVQGWFD